MKLHIINTGLFKLDGGAMFGSVPKTIWNKLNPADDNNLCNWAMRSLLIEWDDRLILIDTGIGNKQSASFLSFYYLHGNDSLLSSLHTLGFTPEDITDVILTHLHLDHCGGGVKRVGEDLLPTFPKAIYWSNQSHWVYALHPNRIEKSSFLQENITPLEISQCVRFVPLPSENSLTTVYPFSHKDIICKVVYGHTKAMMIPMVRYQEKTFVFCSDLIPSTFHIPINYIAGYDMHPLISIQEKEMFLAEALTYHYILVFQHDPFYECCTLMQTAKGIRCNKVGKLSDFL